MFVVYPYVYANHQFSLPDHLIQALYYKIADAKLNDVVWFDGTMNCPNKFMEHMKRSDNLVSIVFESDNGEQGKAVGIGWINAQGYNFAFAHFVFLPEIWGAKSLAAGHALLDYWFKFSVIDFLLGLIPKFNAHACNYVERLGWTKVGEIPKWAIRKDEKHPGVLYYIERPE